MVDIPNGIPALAQVTEAELTYVGTCIFRIGDALPSLRSLEIDGGLRDVLLVDPMLRNGGSFTPLSRLDHCFSNLGHIPVDGVCGIFQFVRLASEFDYLLIFLVLDPSAVFGVLAELILFISDGASGSFQISAPSENGVSYVATFAPPAYQGRTSSLDIMFLCTDPIKPLPPLQGFQSQIAEVTIQLELVPEFKSLWHILGRLRRINVELRTLFGKSQVWSKFSKVPGHKLGGLGAVFKDSTISLLGNHDDVIQSANTRTLRLEGTKWSNICVPRSFVVEVAIQLGLLPAEKGFNLELHCVSLSGQ